jgi:hypothetical protein
MNADELRARLKTLGIPVGEWTATEEKHNVVPPTIQRQKKALREVEGVLHRQMEEDQQRVADLHATLQRLKHGGGHG